MRIRTQSASLLYANQTPAFLQPPPGHCAIARQNANKKSSISHSVSHETLCITQKRHEKRFFHRKQHKSFDNADFQPKKNFKACIRELEIPLHISSCFLLSFANSERKARSEHRSAAKKRIVSRETQKKSAKMLQ